MVKVIRICFSTSHHKFNGKNQTEKSGLKKIKTW